MSVKRDLVNVGATLVVLGTMIVTYGGIRLWSVPSLGTCCAVTLGFGLVAFGVEMVKVAGPCGR